MTLDSVVDAWRKLWTRNEEPVRQPQACNNRSDRSRSTTQKKKKKRPKKHIYLHKNTYDRSTFLQQTLLGESLEKDDVESFGDLLGEKEEKTIRIGLQNIKNLSENSNTDKSHKLFKYIKETNYDIFNDRNRPCLSYIEPENQWFERVCTLTRSKLSYVFNIKEKKGRLSRLPGGVAMIATDQVAHRMTAMGTDLTGLGRWTCMTFRGKNNIMLRVVTWYRPCEATGVSTTYQQQL